jgi:hypothetical protein
MLDTPAAAALALECVAILRDLAAGNLRPEEVDTAIAELEGRYGRCRAERAALATGDGTRRHAVLVDDGERTIALGWSPTGEPACALAASGSLPDRVLLEVDGRTLGVGEAFALLDLAWGDDRLPLMLLDRELVRRAAGISGRVVSRQLLAAVREQEIGPLVTARFEQNPGAYARSVLGIIAYPERAPAARTVAALVSGELDFTIAAARAAAGRPLSRWTTVRSYFRGDLPAPLAEAVASAKPGEVQGPLALGPDFLVVRMVRTDRPILDGPTRKAVASTLFREWLAAGRRRLEPQWTWGTHQT